MSISLFVERLTGAERSISLEDWRRVVSQEPELRFRTDAHVAVNPMAGDQIRLQAGEADSEFFSGGDWQPFLRLVRGKLITKYRPEFEEPGNEVRSKLAAVARALNASLMTDVDDEPLNW
ncbi:hypothetical protein ACSFBX_34990 [Variovorax sp. RB2P76]|uniref:hypothetical protein n=1 Tax=Variovorax sp. RB2P76 TaxID=3443736 RepID=UPI003F482CBA